jgi:hypothetical protein
MTPNDLKAWMKAMGIRSRAEAARQLGYSAETVNNWLNGYRRTKDGKAPAPIPPQVAYVCAALYHRLKPWGPGSP